MRDVSLWSGHHNCYHDCSSVITLPIHKSLLGYCSKLWLPKRPRTRRGAAAPRVEDTSRGEMLMPHSEPVADANDLDLPREVHIELQSKWSRTRSRRKIATPRRRPSRLLVARCSPRARAACCAAPSAVRADPVREIVCWTLRTTSTVHAHTHCTASHGVRRRLPPSTITRIRTEL